MRSDILCPYKRIAHLLLPHSAFRSMTGKQTRLVGQGKYLRPDAVLQLLPARAGQVGATNGARKDDVTAETDTCASTALSAEILDIQNAVSWRVPGCEADFEFHASQPQYLSLVKIDRGLGARVDIKAEECPATSCPP